MDVSSQGRLLVFRLSLLFSDTATSCTWSRRSCYRFCLFFCFDNSGMKALSQSLTYSNGSQNVIDRQFFPFHTFHRFVSFVAGALSALSANCPTSESFLHFSSQNEGSLRNHFTRSLSAGQDRKSSRDRCECSLNGSSFFEPFQLISSG